MTYTNLPAQGDGTTTISDGTASNDVTISGNTSTTTSGGLFHTGASDGGFALSFSQPVYGLRLDMRVFDRGESYEILINGVHYNVTQSMLSNPIMVADASGNIDHDGSGSRANGFVTMDFPDGITSFEIVALHGNIAGSNILLGIDIQLQPTPICFANGTLIETSKGLKPVEALKVGDRVDTLENGFQPIKWIGKIQLNASQLENFPKLRPIIVRKGALGPSIPDSDLRVSPQHRILVVSEFAQEICGESKVLVSAKKLTDLSGFEVDHECEHVEYYHIMFENHEVVYANGALAESLYLGPTAKKMISSSAREELEILFPELFEEDFEVVPAACMPEGSIQKQIVASYSQNGATVSQVM